MHPFKPVDKPVIEFGAPHPGAFAVVNGQPRWDGELFWDTVHGEATSLWVAGRVAGIYNARIADGSRVDELKPGIPESRNWRRYSDDGVMVHGLIEMGPDDIVFADNPDQPAAGRWATGSLPSYLLASSEALNAVEDSSFAVDLYGSLCSSVWALRSSGKEYRGTWERAADIVAQMRSRGEISVDFYLNGNEGYVTEEVSDLLGSIGWTLLGRMETAEQMLDRAAKLVAVCEARPVGEMPDWYVHWISGLRDGPDLDARLHRAAFAGKVPFREWVKFWELFEFDE